MSTVQEKITTIETKVTNVEQVVVKDLKVAVDFAAKVEHVITDVIKHAPEVAQLKVSLKGTAVDGAAIAAELVAVLANKGANWTLDADLVGKVQNFLIGRIAGELVPEFEKLSGELVADVKAA